MSSTGSPAPSDSGILQQSILAANKITYKLPPDISVASARNNQSQFFGNQSYSPGAIAVCIWNTGSQYVHPVRTYLSVTVQNLSALANATAVSVWWGSNGSACNMVNRHTFSSRSGTVIELLQNANQLASFTSKFRHNRTWAGDEITPGCAQMYGAGENALATGGMGAPWTGGATGQSIRFPIPLGEFSPFFANCTELLPATLASGARQEILLEQAAIALIAGTASSINNYQIVDIRIEAECYQLSDLVLRALNDQAANSALDIVSLTAYDTTFSRVASTSINVDCAKAVSRAVGFLYRERPSTPNNTTSPDYFASYIVDGTNYPVSYQARLGGLYFPQSSVRATAGQYRSAAVELYAITLQSLGHFGWGSEGVACNVGQYMGAALSTSAGVSPVARFQVYQSMERSDVLSGSGQPMSNARALNVQMGWQTTATTTGDLFLFYTVLVRCFLSGTNVEV